MRHRTIAVAVLFAAALAACATPKSRIEKHRAQFDAYPPDVQRKIQDGKVDVGFTQEQASLALGKPDRIYKRKSAGGEQEVWAYGIGGSPRVGLGFGMATGGPVGFGTEVGFAPDVEPQEQGAKLRVVFENGIVSRVESRER